MSSDSPTPERLFTVPEAAHFLSVSVPTVRRLMQSRQIAFRKVGGSIRFSRNDIDVFVEKSRVESVSTK
jgi:excisionase family DNA binding protein